MPSTQLVSCLALMLVACGVENEPSPIEDAEPEPIDQDGDGVLEADDCDDQDSTLGAQALDGDCDGALTADDCDDNDPTSATRALDGDCDLSLIHI